MSPLVKANLDALCRRKRFGITRKIKAKLRRISRSAVERLLREERRKRRLKGRSTAKKGALLKNQIPARVFWAWDEKKAGFCEIDTVSHDGGGAISPHYARFEGEGACAALAKVYRRLCPLLNYFYPWKKLLSKEWLPNGGVKKSTGRN
jgi:hypothetical protein